MSTPPTTSKRPDKQNRIGIEKEQYRGRPSTLCPGCGHDSITRRIIDVAWELGIAPHRVMKLSGIGCSSKSPAYFLDRSHGFNTVHGRMAAVATGAVLANRSLHAVGVSGDGDTGSIGIAGFKHLVRRNVPMIYIVENNGVYGLTKGQFSATADPGQVNKYAGGTNPFPTLDLCVEALVAEGTFVARSFAGDARQVREILAAAFSHRGTAFLDIISPCVTFNNREDSTKSYPWAREHETALADYRFIPDYEEISAEAPEEGEVTVSMHDGSLLRVRKISSEYDPTDKMAALRLLERAKQEQLLLTGIFFVDQNRPSLPEYEHLPEQPLVAYDPAELRPGREQLAELMSEVMREKVA